MAVAAFVDLPVEVLVDLTIGALVDFDVTRAAARHTGAFVDLTVGAFVELTVGALVDLTVGALVDFSERARPLTLFSFCGGIIAILPLYGLFGPRRSSSNPAALIAVTSVVSLLAMAT